KAQLPLDVTTETTNKVCASGMRSLTLADQIIRSGVEGVIVAGGTESMSNAPYILRKARKGLRKAGQKAVDLMSDDGLTCSLANVHMGRYGNTTDKEFVIERKEQDK